MTVAVHAGRVWHAFATVATPVAGLADALVRLLTVAVGQATVGRADRPIALFALPAVQADLTAVRPTWIVAEQIVTLTTEATAVFAVVVRRTGDPKAVEQTRKTVHWQLVGPRLIGGRSGARNQIWIEVYMLIDLPKFATFLVQSHDAQNEGNAFL